ncbi:sulfatase-like hydrolase/transferase [Neobacillus sp. SAB-20_R2A]|uniref:sulfatase-like hydrolase/transferase n=1 Tax=Neobacillus sp. SAB-20_R2A TaxID=3120519 RepID=UPI003C6DCD44
MTFKNSQNKPNIVFILSDDQGAWAMGCAGNTEIKTPNLDRLATNGIRFENFFCTSPVCSPARASMLTGRIPSQHGVHDWIREGNTKDNPIEYLENQLTYVDLLAKSNYTCGISGKWHLGNSTLPQKGFTHWYVHESGGGPYYNAPMIRNGERIIEPEYITDAITNDALQFIDKNSKSDQPFYLSVHYTAPHSPWVGHHPQEYLDLYSDCTFDSCPIEENHPWMIKNPPGYQHSREKNLQGYYAAVSAMDMNIGRILDKLEQLGLSENTLVCFFGDNGMNMGHHGIWGKGNGTFPQNMYDTSVKVPAILSQPGRIPLGKVNDSLLSGYDFMPTILEYVGIENPISNELPGKSFNYIIEDKEIEERESVVVFDEYGPVRMIRSKEWKYVHRYPYGPHELYDLVNDPDEKNNLIDVPQLNDIVSKMRERLDEWFFQFVDPAIDGAREPVFGNGQILLAGIKSKGKKSYATWDE